MRIKFNPIKPANSQYIINDINDFNIPELLFFHHLTQDEKIILTYLQSYSDHCRYDLHIVKGFAPFIGKNKIINAPFCFIELKTLFEIPSNFILFRDNYVNYWGRDSDINIIKPYIIVAGNEERHIAISAFRSLATSFFRRITEIIGVDNLIIVKKNDKFVLGFRLNHYLDSKLDIIIEYFCNAIYEIVKATEFYGYYEIPEIDYKVKVNMADQYKLTKQRNFLKKRLYKME